MSKTVGKIYRKKRFPDEYPPEVVDVMKVFSFKYAQLKGSAQIRSQLYAGDFDMSEEVKLPSVAAFASGFTNIVKNIYHSKGLYLGDIKCGIIQEWSVIRSDAQIKDGKPINYNPAESKKKLDELLEKGVISKTEHSEAYSLLKDSADEFLLAKKEIRFDTVRWSYADVVAGFTILRDGREFSLEEAIQTPGLCKVDAIGWVENRRYSEFSCIYSVSVKGKILNDVKENLSDSMKNEFRYFVAMGNYFKYAKRLFSYARIEGDEELGEKLIPLLSGELGRLYQMSGDIATLEYLVENEDNLDAERIRYEIVGFKQRLGTVYSFDSIFKEENAFLADLKKLERLPPKGSAFLANLKKLQQRVDDAVNSETKPILESMGLLPIPKLLGASLLGSGGSDWVVAIPSYKRPALLQKKTLTTLRNGKVPASKIFVFVANKEEEKEYKEALDPTYYNKMIVGKLGIANQRQFIIDHFPKDKLILYIDDDINKLVRRVNDKKLATVSDIPALINHGFDIMKKEGANTWSIYASANPYYMTPGYSTDLKYMMGGFYGIRNTKNPAYRWKYGDNQEDKERTLRYWVEDKKLVRLNDISLKTTVYTPGGILAVQPDRIKRTKEATEELVKEFPTLVSQIHKKSRGIYDIKFRVGKATLEGLGLRRRAKTDDTQNTERTTLTIRNKSAFEAAKERLLEVLRRTTIPPLGKPGVDKVYNRARKLGTKGRTMTLGFGDTRHGIKEYSRNQKYPELLKAVAEFGNLIVPKGWDYNGITINEGVKANKHKDSKNLGRSVIIGIGDFKGGDIKVWDANDKDPKVFDLHDKPVFFNGGLLFHQTTPFSGERYTMVFYKQMWEGTVKGVPMVGKGEGDEVETGGIFA
jgi:hypothetical protein